MQITDVRIRRIEKEGSMKAVVSITIEYFIAMPSRMAADGEYRDIAHPINARTREMIQSVILEKYFLVIESET